MFANIIGYIFTFFSSFFRGGGVEGIVDIPKYNGPTKIGGNYITNPSCILSHAICFTS